MDKDTARALLGRAPYSLLPDTPDDLVETLISDYLDTIAAAYPELGSISDPITQAVVLRQSFIAYINNMHARYMEASNSNAEHTN